MKILFLDIDGVMNSLDNAYSLSSLWRFDNKKYKSWDQFGQLFDERCVRWYTWIIEKTNCKIVISSSWRKSGIKTMKLIWESRNLIGEIIDVTPDNCGEKDFYDDNKTERGYEIQQWLDLHSEVTNYCIVDDNDDMLENQLPFFVKTGKYGLDYKSSHEVVNILNNNI